MTKRKGKGVSGRDFCTKHDLCLCDPEDGPDPDCDDALALLNDGGSESLVAIAKWLGEAFIDSGPNGEIYIETADGEARVAVGDWIVRSHVGNIHHAPYVGVIHIDSGPDPDREHDERANGDRDEADARAWADVPAGTEVKE